MDTTTGGILRLYTQPAAEPSREFTPPTLDAHELANRELIRPHTRLRGHRGPDPFSHDWFEEIEQRRYARHNSWLPGALEFGRHPGESVLLLHPGLGTDAGQYLHSGSEVTLAFSPDDHAELVHANLARKGLAARAEPWDGTALPFTDGEFDVAVWNGLHSPATDAATVAAELFRVLKPGGKVIGLFPARYDAGYWQDLAFPLQHLYWHRPPDPTTTAKTTSRSLRSRFALFEEYRVHKRHLRRSELPHLWRLWPLALLERILGRVLILKALKPLSAHRTATTAALGRTALAA